MDRKAWVIVTEDKGIGDMLTAARKVSGSVAAAVVGHRDLSLQAAQYAFDEVLFLDVKGSPSEACGDVFARELVAAEPDLVLASSTPESRVLLGIAAARLGCPLVGSVVSLGLSDTGCMTASRLVANDRAVENLVFEGKAAVIFIGDEETDCAGASAPISEVDGNPVASIRIDGSFAHEESASGLLEAKAVVGFGMGLRRQEDVAIIQDLADALGAEVACTLPICDDMHWLGPDRVLGFSHNQVAPAIYVAVGTSGMPQHLSGVRGAKAVVAVNNNPEAPIFKNCNYGVVGDLYKIVPELTRAIMNS